MTVNERLKLIKNKIDYRNTKLRKHTFTKDHKCSNCSLAFKLKWELKKHLVVHSTNKPWPCTSCYVSLKMESLLKENCKTRNHNRVAIFDKK